MIELLSEEVFLERYGEFIGARADFIPDYVFPVSTLDFGGSQKPEIWCNLADGRALTFYPDYWEWETPPADDPEYSGAKHQWFLLTWQADEKELQTELISDARAEALATNGQRAETFHVIGDELTQ